MKRRNNRFGHERPEFMKFGKYKNTPISKLPDSYIEWFCSSVEGCDNIKEAMQDALLERWQASPESEGGCTSQSCGVVDNELFREFRDIVRKGK